MVDPLLDASQFWFSVHDGRLAHYESSWGYYVDQFRRLSSDGAALAEFVRIFDRDLELYRGFIYPGIAEVVPNLDLGRFAGLAAPLRLAVEDGRYVALPETRAGFEVLLPALDRGLDAGADCVVEFGSGLGTNLARLRLRHPQRKLTYIACEPTESGRTAAAMMFAGDPGMAAEVRVFDYADADFGFLGAYKRPLAFTSHSVEQVALLGDEFYTRLLASNVATCVHMEPVGWQRYTNIYETVLAMMRDQAVYDRILRAYRWVIEDARLADNAAMWSAHHVYNIDLLRQVSGAAERGEVTLFALAYDVAGLNPFNPSSLIGWTRQR